MLLGVTGSDPSMYKPDQHILDIPHTWVLDTCGNLYHGRSETSGVCVHGGLCPRVTQSLYNGVHHTCLCTTTTHRYTSGM